MAESQSTSNAPGDPTKITRLRELLSRHQEKGWDEAWKDEATPWDAGTMQPALQELVESSELDLPKSGRALVPGCGRGYDAVFVARSLGLETIGIDISPTAIEAANEYKRAVDPTANVRFEETSFFALNDTSFELVYDYTFFVALPLSMRPEWGIQMGKIVKHGGFLITLVLTRTPVLLTMSDRNIMRKHSGLVG
ncbi:S-adenosyl-L-methionine-dependent methyltransferase [Cubamyces menziesii]|nr:S-adenosyl-L-methionine-dependent methyltransferase [Cubamyces menziesii]